MSLFNQNGRSQEKAKAGPPSYYAGDAAGSALQCMDIRVGEQRIGKERSLPVGRY